MPIQFLHYTIETFSTANAGKFHIPNRPKVLQTQIQ